ncbi:MAG: hypothetical protein H6728_05285 [Myxococcales bacterium]|nr:hypothetical protein [Myxococcales bacterium]
MTRIFSTDFYLAMLFLGCTLCVGMSLFSSLFYWVGRRLSVFRGLGRFWRGTKGRRWAGPLWAERLWAHLPMLVGLWATFFGALGLLLMRVFSFNWFESFWLSLPTSLLTMGFLGGWAWSVFFLDEELGALRGSVLYGMVAQVSLTIPASGVGQISFVSQGSRTSMPARSKGGLGLPSQTRVVIVDLEGPIAIVEIC